MIEKYNKNLQGKSSGDAYADWIYQRTEMKIPDTDVSEAWAKVSNKIVSPQKSVRSYASLRVAAAVIVLTVATFIFYTNTRPELIEIAATDTKELVKLPDGSSVVINSNSSISFLEEFSDIRKVKLQGEGYFDIVKNKTPFLVEINNATVKVLGTAFNIHSTDDQITVFVDEGVVQFGTAGDEVKLIKGNIGVLDRGSLEIAVSDKAPSNVMSWRNGQFVFDEHTLKEATDQLSNYYKIPFRFSPKIENCKITASFDDASLNEVVQVLEAILDLNVSKTNSSVTIKGKGC